ncbi:MAG: hypothetical protein VYE15_03980, partial [Myxococcota bacterium]|nr:hypothetical protein [Myxococcota bacterium]
MWWRRLLVLALGGVLLSLASCQAADPGQMDLVFRWPDGAPSWSAETPYSLWGRIERWPGGEPAGAVLVGEATGPTGKTYAVLGESAEGLTFAQVPYGDHLVVVIAVRQGAVDGTPSEGDELVYYGHSNPFSLQPGDKVTVEVDLELQPAPGAGTQGEDGLVGGGALWICPSDTTTTDPEADCAITHINSADVRLYVRAPNATSLVVANDLSLSKARKVVALTDPEQASPVSSDVYALT